MDPVANTDPLALWAFVIPLIEWTASEAALYLGSSIVGGALLATSTNSQQKPIRTDEEESQADKEYAAYKQRCEQKPENNLSRCAAAIFEKNKREDCLKMRTEWDNKWFPGRHSEDINNEQRGLKNAIKDVINRCKPTNGVPR